MAKITTPKGEEVVVLRRWFPWPHFATYEQLSTWGLSESAAKFLGSGYKADFAILGAILFLPFVLFITGSFTLFVVLTLIGLILVTVRFLALPWKIEVVHEDKIVESEDSAGFSVTGERLAKIASLYQSGALKLPIPPPKEPSLKSSLPLPEGLPNLNTDPAEAIFTDPVEIGGSTSTPREEDPSRVDPEGLYSGDTPLRRAIRLLEAEQKELARLGVDPSTIFDTTDAPPVKTKRFFKKK